MCVIWEVSLMANRGLSSGWDVPQPWQCTMSGKCLKPVFVWIMTSCRHSLHDLCYPGSVIYNILQDIVRMGCPPVVLLGQCGHSVVVWKLSGIGCPWDVLRTFSCSDSNGRREIVIGILWRREEEQGNKCLDMKWSKSCQASVYTRPCPVNVLFGY